MLSNLFNKAFVNKIIKLLINLNKYLVKFNINVSV